MRPLCVEIVAECAQLLLARIQTALRALRRLHIQPRQFGLKWLQQRLVRPSQFCH